MAMAAHGPSGPSVGVSDLTGSSTAPLEGELRELVMKMQQTFTQLIQPQTTIVGDSVEDSSGMSEEMTDATTNEEEANDLNELIEIGGGIAAGGVGGSIEKQKPVPMRKALPVQKLSYSQLQASAMRQSYQTTVHANNLVHHAHSLLGLVSRIKLAVLLSQAAQDRSRQEVTPEMAAESALIPPHPLELPHPSTIPPQHFPLHLQRTQQQLHHTALELQAQMKELERQVEDEQLAQQTNAATSNQTQQR